MFNFFYHSIILCYLATKGRCSAWREPADRRSLTTLVFLDREWVKGVCACVRKKASELVATKQYKK